MKIYISIPIANDPKAMERANLIKARLSREGHTPVNPFEIHAGHNPTYEDHICYDLRAMLGCDAVLFCKGWGNSFRCNVEHDVAMRIREFRNLDFKIMYEDQPVSSPLA